MLSPDEGSMRSWVELRNAEGSCEMRLVVWDLKHRSVGCFRLWTIEKGNAVECMRGERGQDSGVHTHLSVDDAHVIMWHLRNAMLPCTIALMHK